jgi:hypothetical protein
MVVPKCPAQSAHAKPIANKTNKKHVITDVKIRLNMIFFFNINKVMFHTFEGTQNKQKRTQYTAHHIYHVSAFINRQK